MNGNSKVKKLMAGGNKIVSCEIKKKGSDGYTEVHAKFDNDMEVVAFGFYKDEHSFTAAQFVGLTLREAQSVAVRAK